MPEDKSQLILQELVRRSNDEIRRLRELEQRIQAIESRFISLENSVLEKTKRYEKKIVELDVAVKNFSDDMERITGQIDKINKQLGRMARKRETLGFSLLEIIKTREINYKYQKKNLVDLVILRTLSNVLERNPTNQYRGFHVF